MNRNAALLALFLVSVAAGVWVFRAPEPASVSTPESCGNDSSCGAASVSEPDKPATAETAPAATGDARDTAASAPVASIPVPRPVPHPAPAPNSADAVAAPPADGAALRAEADRLIAEGRVLEGIEAMRRAAEVDPTAKNHGDLGSLLERLTAMDEALVHLSRAAELDPGNADRWIALANAYYHAVNPGEAWKAEKRAKQAEPGLVLGRDKNGRRVRQGDSEPRKP